MRDLSGNWFIDGIDLFTTFNVFIEEGSADFLKFPPKKESIEHDWQDANGIEVDLSQIFFGPREGTLNLAIIATSQADFFAKQSAFISHFTQPGKRRFTLTSHGERSYYIHYQECNNYKAVKPLTGEESGLFAYRFSMVIREPEPKIDPSDIFLIDEEGRFLIT